MTARISAAEYRAAPKKRNAEAELHRAVATYLTLALPETAVWTTFPAGGGGKARGGKLKAMGLRAGWPDIQIIYQGRFVGIELKAEKGYISEAQCLTHAAINMSGGDCYVCRSLDDVIVTLEAACILKRRRT